MNKKYIFLPIALLIILSIGYYFFSLYRNSDNSPNESKTIYPANEIIKLNTDIYSPNESAKTDEDNLPSETNQQDAGEKYTVFIFYIVFNDHIIAPFFQVDIKHKTIKGIQEGFEKKDIYYRIADGKEVYPKGFDKSLISPHDDYETEYMTTTNDFKQGDYFIDRKMDWEDLGEQPKTTDDIRLFFEAFFRNNWGQHFYEENILDDIDNIEKKTGVYIRKITDMDKDQNLEYWIHYEIQYGEGYILYERNNNNLINLGSFYVGGD